MSPSDMTVWDRLAMLFPTCTADEIRDWYGDEGVSFVWTDYEISTNTLTQHRSNVWLNAEQLRAAIDATAKRDRPWHEVAQEALADWAKGNALDAKFNGHNNAIDYPTWDDEYGATIRHDGRIEIFDTYSAKNACNEHNEIAGLLRAAGLTQFKCYKLVEDTEQ